MTRPYSHHVKRAKTEQSVLAPGDDTWRTYGGRSMSWEPRLEPVPNPGPFLSPGWDYGGGFLEYAPEWTARAKELDNMYGPGESEQVELDGGRLVGPDYGKGLTVSRLPAEPGDYLSFMRAPPQMSYHGSYAADRFSENSWATNKGGYASKEHGLRSPLARNARQQEFPTYWMEDNPPLAYTSPRQEYERHYPREVLNRLVSSAQAAQEQWQRQNPGSLISPVIPNYDPKYFDRKMPIFGASIKPWGIENIGYPRNREQLPKPILDGALRDAFKGRNAAYLPVPGSGAFLDEAPELGRYAALPATQEGAALNAADRSKHPFHSAVGLHEALHALQNTAAMFPGQGPSPGVELESLLVDDEAYDALPRGQAEYPIAGAGGLEMPAHLAEMKAHYYGDTKTEPFMDTPEQRKAFMDYWRNEFGGSSMSDLQKHRYKPVFKYLDRHPDPKEQEFLLRSIVSSQPYSEYRA